MQCPVVPPVLPRMLREMKTGSSLSMSAPSPWILQVAVIQFSTESRVEIPLGPLDEEAVPSLATRLDNIVSAAQRHRDCC